MKPCYSYHVLATQLLWGEGQHNAFILLLCKQHLIVKENFYTT